MFFVKNNEVDLNYYNNNLYKRLLLYKLNESVSILSNVKIFYIFRNIMLVNGLYIFNYFLFIWLVTGNLSFIHKYDSIYQRGIHYFRFMLVLKENSFVMLDFFLNFFFSFLNEDDIELLVFTDKRVLLNLKSYILFSNMRLSTNLYLYELDDALYLDFSFEKYGNLFISMLKLNYFLQNKKN